MPPLASSPPLPECQPPLLAPPPAWAGWYPLARAAVRYSQLDSGLDRDGSFFLAVGHRRAACTRAARQRRAASTVRPMMVVMPQPPPSSTINAPYETLRTSYQAHDRFEVGVLVDCREV